MTAASPPAFPKSPPTTGATVPWKKVLLFAIVSCGFAWLIAIPLWRTEAGLASPITGLVLPAVMFTPCAATLTVLLLRPRTGARGALQLLGMWPVWPIGRTLGFTALAVVSMPVVVSAGIAIAAALGFVKLDILHLSGFRTALETASGSALPVPVWTIAAVQLLTIPLGAAVNAVLAFGEEVGWRGWLLPALLPMGRWPALLVSGALWGAWHSPIVLLGYNFGEPNLGGVGLMMVATTLLGVIFGWLRLTSGSLWPAVLAHGSLNAAGGLINVFADEGEPVDLTLAGPLGVGSWVAMALVVVVLILTRQLPIGTAPQRRRMRR